MNIALIACSKRKLGQNEPNKLFKAQDIYRGNTFLKSKNEGVAKFACDDFFILSAKYGFLEKDEQISYYNKKLGDQTLAYKKQWAENVIEKLEQKGFDLENDVFYIFGGKDYYKGLLPFLGHAVVFEFKSSNSIDLEKPIEYHFGEKAK